MRIVALDPGGTTGVCEVDTDTEQFFQFQIGPDEHHLELWQYLGVSNPDVVVCEQFFYQRRDLEKGVSLVIISREYIGIAKLYCREMNKPIEMQGPSYMKLWPDSKLRKINLYRPGMTHANDATRHLLYYLTVKAKMRKWVDAAREPE